MSPLHTHTHTHSITNTLNCSPTVTLSLHKMTFACFADQYPGFSGVSISVWFSARVCIYPPTPPMFCTLTSTMGSDSNIRTCAHTHFFQKETLDLSLLSVCFQCTLRFCVSGAASMRSKKSPHTYTGGIGCMWTCPCNTDTTSCIRV